MPDWDLPQLRALAAVVDEGSLEAAARVLYVTPSAVSQRLKALEQSVGAVLVNRSRPARATAAGERIVLLARQIEVLTAEAEAGSDAGRMPQVRLAINADSLATWALRALAPLACEIRFDVVREDEERTADLIRDGSVMAAVTSQAVPVQGCSVEPLGVMRYIPVAAPAVAARILEAREDPRRLATAIAGTPILVFDQHDTMQDQTLVALGVDPATPPRHYIPAANQFAEAVALGFGWGMVPQPHVRAYPGGAVVILEGVPHLDVTLYWQQWSLRTPSLDRVAEAIRDGARRDLLPATP